MARHPALLHPAKLVLRLLVAAHVGLACGSPSQGTGGGSVTTQVAPLQLDISLGADNAVTTALAGKSQAKTLRAYLLDGSNTQVLLRAVGATGALASGSAALPVNVEGAQTSLQVEALVPVSSSHAGVALQLQNGTASRSVFSKLAVVAADNGVLAALAPTAQDGSLSASLTPASTLATVLVAQTLPAATGATQLAAYAAVTPSLTAAQTLLGQQLVSSQLAFDVYNAALYAGLAGYVLLDAPTQQAVALALRNSAANANDASAAATGQALAGRYDDALLALGLTARSALGTPTTAASQAYASSYAATQAAALVGQTGQGASFAYAPKLQSFADTDYTASVGGNLLIAPAPVAGGITGYNVYLGGGNLTSSHGIVLGSAAAGSDANAVVTFVIPAGTALPATMPQLWVFPVSSQRELSVGAQLVVNNVTVPAATPTATPGPNRVSVAWAPVSGADSYNLFRGAQPGLDANALLLKGATSPFTDTNVDVGVPLYYGVNVVQHGVQGAVHTTAATAPTASAPPQLTALADAAGGNVLLSWTAVDLATGYNLYLDSNAAVSQTAAAQPNLTVQNLSVAVPWSADQYAAVSATLRGRETALSNVARLHSLLAPPQQVNAFSPAAGEVQLAWLPVPGAVAYRIYSATHTGVTTSDSFVYTPTNLVISQDVTNSVLNTFAVLAIDSNGNTSELSTEVSVVPGVVPLQNGEMAATVWGQADGNSNLVQASLDASHFAGAPAGLAWSDALTTLFVADPRANRVLGFLYPPAATSTDANVVLGQPAGLTKDKGTNPNQLAGPVAASTDDANNPLWVVDANNARVLAFANVDNDGSYATCVLGAAHPAGPGRQVAASNGFVLPAAVSVGGGKLVVVDSGGHRVLLYNQVPSANDANADVVLGQPDFVSATANNGNLSASSLQTPSSAYTDGNTLVVYDYGNSRVLIWDTFPTLNGQPADWVLGQPDMLHNTDNPNVALFPNGLAQHHRTDTPLPQLACNGAELAVADPGNSRILLWAAIPRQNFVPATAVLGQTLMTTQTSNNPPQQNTLSRPVGVAFAGALNLWVADTGNNRVLRYGL